jgi:lipopolysaccharide biosynthesis regulator YciM
MVIGKIQKNVVPVSPHELAQKIANEGFKGAVEQAISGSEKEYRAQYKKLLESKKKAFAPGVNRFQSTEADSVEFLEEIYQNLPSFFKKMIDDAVSEQAKFNKLSQKHQNELKHELADVIDQELRLKGKFA